MRNTRMPAPKGRPRNNNTARIAVPAAALLLGGALLAPTVMAEQEGDKPSTDNSSAPVTAAQGTTGTPSTGDSAVDATKITTGGSPAASLADALLPQSDTQNDAPAVERTTTQQLAGLPEGLWVDHVDWLSQRRVAVWIHSKSMPNKLVQVQILLARDWWVTPDRTFPAVYLLDGQRATEEQNGWTEFTNVTNQFSDRNVNVILPVGGESSFYTDWQSGPGDNQYKWETFLAEELPLILKAGWRTNDTAAIVGLSMGGTGAINLAERHPNLYQFVGSFSGYLDTSSYGMPQAIGWAINDVSKFNAEEMWGPYGSAGWAEHDPKLHMDALRGKSIYVSAGNGLQGSYDNPGSIPGMPDNTAGYGLEVLSRMTTQTFVSKAKQMDLPLTVRFRPSGTHRWEYWSYELSQAWDQMADALSLSADDRGATCTTGGAIGDLLAADAALATTLGQCVTGEYDTPNGGKAQDFQSGRVFWSPATGAHAVYGLIGARYAALGGPNSYLGYPVEVNEVDALGGGRMSWFEHGNIYFHEGSGAWDVPTDTIGVWKNTGYEGGVLGYPTAAPSKTPKGDLTQTFTNGAIVIPKSYTAQEEPGVTVQGDIFKAYQATGGFTSSRLGMPTTSERDGIAGTGVKLSNFEQGVVYSTLAGGAHPVYAGPIFDEYARIGFEGSRLGAPTADPVENPDGSIRQDFAGGYIVQTGSTAKAFGPDGQAI